mmetsp:Transcript_44222/g.74480  ORF Transcript_44222/g.74480 Transcript_44222/m.74480 type:complete len:87 (+) Transcript_44222:32-292(+)
MSTAYFTVEGMTCGSCTGLLTDVIGKMDIVQSVNVSLEDKKATVTFKGAADDASKAAIAEQITKCGFQVKPCGCGCAGCSCQGCCN